MAGRPFAITIVPSSGPGVREIVVESALLDADISTSLVKQDFVQRYNIPLDDEDEEIVRDSSGNAYHIKGHFFGNWRFIDEYTGHPPMFAVVRQHNTIFPQNVEVLLKQTQRSLGPRGGDTAATSTFHPIHFTKSEPDTVPLS